MNIYFLNTTFRSLIRPFSNVYNMIKVASSELGCNYTSLNNINMYTDKNDKLNTYKTKGIILSIT